MAAKKCLKARKKPKRPVATLSGAHNFKPGDPQSTDWGGSLSKQMHFLEVNENDEWDPNWNGYIILKTKFNVVQQIERYRKLSFYVAHKL